MSEQTQTGKSNLECYARKRSKVIPAQSSGEVTDPVVAPIAKPEGAVEGCDVHHLRGFRVRLPACSILLCLMLQFAISEEDENQQAIRLYVYRINVYCSKYELKWCFTLVTTPRRQQTSIDNTNLKEAGHYFVLHALEGPACFTQASVHHFRDSFSLWSL